jgi:hypothetical protein
VKPRHFINILILLLASTAVGQDWRVVNGISVNLGPVHDWLSTFPRLQSERPMPHWKLLHISEFKTQLAGWDQCLVENEDGQVVEVLIAHLEPAIHAAFSQLASIRSTIIALRNQIYADEDQMAALPATSTIVVTRMRRTLVGRIAQEREQFARLQITERQAISECRRVGQLGFLAMRSDAYGGLPIWDCGEKR